MPESAVLYSSKSFFLFLIALFLILDFTYAFNVPEAPIRLFLRTIDTVDSVDN